MFHLFYGQRGCLKSFERLRTVKLDFANTIEVVTETEDAANMARQTVWTDAQDRSKGSAPAEVYWREAGF